MKTILFVCGTKSLKVMVPVLMPRKTRLTKSEVDAVLTTPLPKLPRVLFESVLMTEECQVLVFCYDDTSGCSVTNSRQHGDLPPPYNRRKLWGKVMEEPMVHVGFQYMYGYDENYSILDGEVVIRCKEPENSNDGDPEIIRTNDMIAALKTQVGHDFEIKQLQSVSSCHCPFRGGGI